MEDDLGGLGQSKGFAAQVLWRSMKARMVSRGSVTLVKTTRRSARRSKGPSHVSTALSHDALVGVKCGESGDARAGSRGSPRSYGCCCCRRPDAGEVGRRRAVDLGEEPPELRRAGATGDPSEHLTGRDVESGVEIGGPVPLVVVGPWLELPGSERQHRVGPVEGLEQVFSSTERTSGLR